MPIGETSEMMANCHLGKNARKRLFSDRQFNKIPSVNKNLFKIQTERQISIGRLINNKKE